MIRPGELYPGGPAELPCWVQIAGQNYRTRYVPAVQVAYYCATSQWGVLGRELLDDDSRSQMLDRMRDLDDPVDSVHAAQMAVRLSIRLAGLGEDILGWRAMMHVAGWMLAHWSQAYGVLAESGIDPVTDQLWRVMSVVHRALASNPMASDEDREWIAQVLKHPLPQEPSCIPGAGSRDAVLEANAESFDALMKSLGG